MYFLLSVALSKTAGGAKMENTKLYVNFLHMRELLTLLNQKIKDARTAYFSDLITTNKHNPQALFSTINQLIQPAPAAICHLN